MNAASLVVSGHGHARRAGECAGLMGQVPTVRHPTMSRRGMPAAALLLAAAACGHDSQPLLPPPCDEIVTVTPSTASLAVGERARFVARMYSCGSQADVRLRWKVMDSAVAALVESHDSADLSVGTVIGRGEGSTAFLATSVRDPTRSAWASVMVMPWVLEP